MIAGFRRSGALVSLTIYSNTICLLCYIYNISTDTPEQTNARTTPFTTAVQAEAISQPVGVASFVLPGSVSSQPDVSLLQGERKVPTEKPLQSINTGKEYL